MSSKWIRDYFTFTKKERLAIVVLIFLILSVYFLPTFLSCYSDPHPIIDVAKYDSIARMFNEGDSNEKAINSKREYPSAKNNPVTAQLFFFDPNRASFEEWNRLGVKEKTIRIIQHYLEKGGQFKRVEDLKKIYGFKEDDYRRLEPYVRMVSTRTTHVFKYDSTERNWYDTGVHHERIKKEFIAVDLNLADSASLCMLPGIGSKLASRIIHFRDKLGGFYSIEQLAETYGLPDSTYTRIKPFLNLGSKALVTININEADITRLRQHPYIGWIIAKALVQYREQHGPFSSVEDISKISAISTEQVKRLIPYLSIY